MICFACAKRHAQKLREGYKRGQAAKLPPPTPAASPEPAESPTSKAEPPEPAESAAAALDWDDPALVRCLRTAKESYSLIKQGYFYVVLRGGAVDARRQPTPVCLSSPRKDDTILLKVHQHRENGMTRPVWMARHLPTGETKCVGIV